MEWLRKWLPDKKRIEVGMALMAVAVVVGCSVASLSDGFGRMVSGIDMGMGWRISGDLGPFTHIQVRDKQVANFFVLTNEGIFFVPVRIGNGPGEEMKRVVEGKVPWN